jgi:hypothetical protein
MLQGRVIELVNQLPALAVHGLCAGS